MNLTVCKGNLTRNPELTYLDSGTAKVTFGLAVNEYVNRKEIVSYFNVVMFGKNAENANNYLEKGRQILITDGHHRQGRWVKDGVKKERWELVVNNWAFNDSKGKEKVASPPADEQPAEQPEPVSASPTDDVPF